MSQLVHDWGNLCSGDFIESTLKMYRFKLLPARRWVFYFQRFHGHFTPFDWQQHWWCERCQGILHVSLPT